MLGVVVGAGLVAGWQCGVGVPYADAQGGVLDGDPQDDGGRFCAACACALGADGNGVGDELAGDGMPSRARDQDSSGGHRAARSSTTLTSSPSIDPSPVSRSPRPGPATAPAAGHPSAPAAAAATPPGPVPPVSPADTAASAGIITLPPFNLHHPHLVFTRGFCPHVDAYSGRPVEVKPITAEIVVLNVPSGRR